MQRKKGATNEWMDREWLPLYDVSSYIIHSLTTLQSQVCTLFPPSAQLIREGNIPRNDLGRQQLSICGGGREGVSPPSPPSLFHSDHHCPHDVIHPNTPPVISSLPIIESEKRKRVRYQLISLPPSSHWMLRWERDASECLPPLPVSLSLSIHPFVFLLLLLHRTRCSWERSEMK